MQKTRVNLQEPSRPIPRDGTKKELCAFAWRSLILNVKIININRRWGFIQNAISWAFISPMIVYISLNS